MDLHDLAWKAKQLPEGGSLPPLDGSVEAMRLRILGKLIYQVGKQPRTASPRDWFVATAYAVRDTATSSWFAEQQAPAAGGKRVYYLSLEFLIGRVLMDTIGNLGLTGQVREALLQCGVDLDDIVVEEPDAALGNGGLGRLAACFMESMSTLKIPAYGYGIRYEHGLFRQVIEKGLQRELPETWLAHGNPWEFARADTFYPVGFGGTVVGEPGHDPTGPHGWVPAETIHAFAYDTPVVGAGGQHTNTLRLWAARAAEPLQLEAFNRGDHVGALRDRVQTEAISRVLYPGDESSAGQELRLRQEYFFASASLQDLLARHLAEFGSLVTLPDKAAIQLNDTHPAIAIIEMMRLLVDVHRIEFDRAWAITNETFSYTNHTLLPEALETWPVALMERLLPRHMQLIYLINMRHMQAARDKGADHRVLAELSLVDELHGRRVRMGHLSFLGCHAINGVSALHSDLVRSRLFQDMDQLYPGRISNKTNGITFRRWLHRANPGLTRLLVETLGDGILADPVQMERLADYADKPALQAAFAAERLACKQRLAVIIRDRTGVVVDPASLFDVQVKRIHEYKRQLLNIVQAIAHYRAILADPGHQWVPRVKIFAGKAAPGYVRAKEIIRLIHDVAQMVNNDPVVGDRLKIVYMPNYNVSLAEQIVPAADLSEQISTAGMEASGTGNMKLALNGALTIGTLDGANIEIRDFVGPENIFIFGLTAPEVAAQSALGLDSHHAVRANPVLSQVIDMIASGVFSPEEPHRYRNLIDGTQSYDRFMLAADFDSYVAAQARVDETWLEPSRWWRMAMLNTARLGWFSSDRSIREYAESIWRVPVMQP